MGLTSNFNGNPSSASNPTTSSNSTPTSSLNWIRQQFFNRSELQRSNFHNDLQNIISPKKLFDPTKYGVTDYAKQFSDNTFSLYLLSKFQAGLALQNSKDPLTRELGGMLLNEVANNLVSTISAFKTPKSEEISKLGLTSFEKKFNNSTFGKHFEAWSLGANLANNILTSFVGDQMYGGPKGNLTLAIDLGWETASNVAAMFGPVGLAVALGMKGANLLNKGVNLALGDKAVDNMTTTDAILNNPLLGWNVGLANALTGSNADTITKDTLALETVGASYTGTMSAVDEALKKSGKRYGGLSSGSRLDANREIAEAKWQQMLMADIADEARNRFDIVGAMSAINGNRRAFAMLGGYDLSAVRLGRHGMTIQDLQKAKRIVNSMKYREGGQVEDLFTIFVSTLPNNLKPTEDGEFNVKRYWELNGKPKNFEEAIERGMYSLEEDGWHAHTVQYNSETDEYEFMKSSTHPTLQYELDWYNSSDPEAIKFRSQYELLKTEPYYKYVRRKGTDQPQTFKEGGNLTKFEEIIEVNINSLPLEFRGTDIEEIDIDNILPEFKEGGKFNLIPEGALHARKHNMDIEGITSKGIPVVSQAEGGEIEQLAEIEREEIIFRLEVTKKLEELAKDGSDLAAIEAGKLLVEEILYNTIDNTNSLI